MADPPPLRVRFGDYELGEARNELRGGPMSAQAAERRLAAIMFTDIVGYTALMAESEEKGLRARERHRELVSAETTT